MKILVVDFHRLFHEALAAAARAVYADAEVLTAYDLLSACIKAREAAPIGLVLLDLCLPGCKDVEALTRFRQEFPEPQVVIVSMMEDAASINGAIAAGAAGYIPKTHPMPLAVAALRTIASGHVYAPPQAATVDAARPKERLTARQVAVLRLISHGLSNKQVAHRLGIAEDTSSSTPMRRLARSVSKSEYRPYAKRRGSVSSTEP